ncbi:hypothetical protein IW140_006176 [Coemansia sp. RSA 1813]|nr:hypothetical protein EV178_003917 [Coemansia sp. RSA 1646]KAJ1766574.1 hypothetical protein LPJ74_005819 [Coemansia sp. RSA 1843]KAJ2085715.1 hypothetical protein IW138_006160 [Coemansia sp. RSA 986]KAJ2210599.1 hypothetical protein EV179_006123 [Coemansia sp. RSA 487]KAJ2563284.1 hypothetical protein IW140_006176 [Coemansia sp. RSA 1813]
MSDLEQLQKLPPLHGQERIAALEKLTGMTVQDNDGSDIAAIVVSCVFLGITLVFMIYTWVNRNYRPIRAKSVKMCTMIYLSSVIWVVGDFQMNGVVRIEGVWKNCRAWVVWVRILFSYIFSGLMMLRFLALDRIFNRGKPYKGKAMYVPAILLTILLLTYCLTCQLVANESISIYVDYFQICNVNDTFRYASIGLMWVPWTVSLVLAVRLRNIEGSFNENYETMAVMALAYMLLIKTTVVQAAHPYFIFNRAFRQSETILDAIAASMIVWIILGHPVYQCMFHHKEYEKRWVNKLRFDGQVDKYVAGFKAGGDEITPYSQIHESEYNSKKDPLETLRVLTQNDQTVTSDLVERPENAYRDPNAEFAPAEMFSDLSIDSEQQYDRRII